MREIKHIYLLLINLVFVHCARIWKPHEKNNFVAKIPDWTKLLDPEDIKDLLVHCACAYKRQPNEMTEIIAKIPDWRKFIDLEDIKALFETEKKVYDANGDIEIKDVPFLVSLIHKDKFTCGGSIIRNDVILTAAHCVIGYNETNLKVRAGSSLNYTGGVLADVKKYVVYPSYTSHLKDGDVAIVWLSEPLVYTDEIQPIALTQSGVDVKVGTLMSVSGYGHENETYVFSQTLQAVIVPVVDPVECDEAYSNRRITANMLCAGYKSGGADACVYDSGGPLVHNGTQYGIVSFGRGCARANYPGVYARISTLQSWIDEQLDAENTVQD